MKLKTLEDLLISELRDLYHAENQIIKALPRMARAASSEELRAAFEEHLEQTRGHVERLEEVFDELGQRPKGKKCEAIEGMIQECKDLMAEDIEPNVLDAGLIACAQKVEHYEMAGYGTVRTWARHLGQESVAELLQETLNEEGETDHKLTELAESMVNLQAAETPT
jgi:ferritin-like metal-binding protein YciE